MINDIYFLYAILLYIAVLIYAFILRKKIKLPLFAAMVFISNAVIMFPRYYYVKPDRLPELSRIVNSVAYSLYHSVTLFGLGGDLYDVRVLKKIIVYFNGETEGLIVSAIATAFYFIAPIITVTAILSFFREVSASVRYFFSFLQNKYIFSELNERSITLAESISEKHPYSACIVFTDVFSKNSETDYELVRRAREINAICFKKDITAKTWARKISLFTKKRLFLIGGDEDENLEQTIELINKYDKNTKKDKVTLYLFSKSSTSELSVHSLLNEDSTVNVIRIDYKRSMIYNYLYERGTKLIERASENNHFDILILGMGEHGFEMLKSMLWFCRRDGYTMKINVYDSSGDACDRFYAQCPGIDRNDGVLKFHTVDFSHGEFFEKELNNHLDANFVFISLGGDSKNIEVARKVREVYAKEFLEKNGTEEYNEKPIITTVVQNSYVKESIEKDNSYNISIIGDFKSVYSSDVILNSELEELAVSVHTEGKEGSDITTYKRSMFYKEYNYRSTIAQVIYHKAWHESGHEGEKWKGFIDAIKPSLEAISKYETEDSEELRGALDALIEDYGSCISDEKERWNNYEFTEGFVKYEGKKWPDNKSEEANNPELNLSRDILKNKLHNHKLILHFSELTDDQKRDEAKYFVRKYEIIYNSKQKSKG